MIISFHLDWGIEVSYDGPFYEKTASENLNALLGKINDQSKEGEQHLVLTDEISADNNGDNFINCLEGVNKLVSLMAVNPAAFGMSKEMNVQPPEGENVTADRMVTKHRNAFPIANLVLHYNHNEKNSSAPYKCLSAADDCPLDALTMAQGPITIWIKQDQSTSDLEVLQYVLDNLLKNDPRMCVRRVRKTNVLLWFAESCRSLDETMTSLGRRTDDDVTTKMWRKYTKLLFF